MYYFNGRIIKVTFIFADRKKRFFCQPVEPVNQIFITVGPTRIIQPVSEIFTLLNCHIDHNHTRAFMEQGNITIPVNKDLSDETIMTDDTQRSIIECNRWLRLAVCTNIHLKKALLSVLHNEINYSIIHGLPTDPKKLCQYLITHKKILDESLKRKILSQDQYSDLLPHQMTVQSSALDITLIRYLIRTFCNISNACNNWKKPAIIDISIAAFVFRAAGIRNKVFHYKNMQTLEEAEFESIWTEMEFILKGLKYTDNIEYLRTEPLDPVSTQRAKDFHSNTLQGMYTFYYYKYILFGDQIR